MADMLNDGGLSSLEIRQPPRHFLKLSLNTVLASLKAFQLFQHQVFSSVSHRHTMPPKRTPKQQLREQPMANTPTWAHMGSRGIRQKRVMVMVMVN